MKSIENPLPSLHFSGPNASGENLSFPDYFHALSEMSVHEHLKQSIDYLYETYIISLDYKNNVSSKSSPILKDTFDEEFANTLQKIKSGISAMSCEEDLESSLCFVFENVFLQHIFPRAVTWLVCTKLLIDHDSTEKAWSSMVHYKEVEHNIRQSMDLEEEEHNTKISSINAKKNYEAFIPLKKHFIYLLSFSKEKPPKGWEYRNEASSKLAKEAYSFYENSSIKENTRLNEDGIAKKLYNWLKNDPECKSAFLANEAPKSSRSSK